MRLIRLGNVCVTLFRAAATTTNKNVIKSSNEGDLLLGKVVQLSQIGLEKLPCVKVRCRLNEFNDYLKKYFAYPEDFWALDTDSQTGLGDDVLIRKIKKQSRPAATVTHSIEKVIFKYGHIIDPITKKRMIEDKFSDEIELRKQAVKEVFEDPFEEESVMFEDRRAAQRERLMKRKTAVESPAAEQ